MSCFDLCSSGLCCRTLCTQLTLGALLILDPPVQICHMSVVLILKQLAGSVLLNDSEPSACRLTCTPSVCMILCQPLEGYDLLHNVMYSQTSSLLKATYCLPFFLLEGETTLVDGVVSEFKLRVHITCDAQRTV